MIRRRHSSVGVGIPANQLTLLAALLNQQSPIGYSRPEYDKIKVAFTKYKNTKKLSSIVEEGNRPEREESLSASSGIDSDSDSDSENSPAIEHKKPAAPRATVTPPKLILSQSQATRPTYNHREWKSERTFSQRQPSPIGNAPTVLGLLANCSSTLMPKPAAIRPSSQSTEEPAVKSPGSILTFNK